MGEHRQRYGLEPSSEAFDPQAAFGRAAPLWLDIGPGMGDSSVALACRFPACNCLALEPYLPGVGRLLWRLAREQAENVRVMRCEARTFLERQLPEPCLDRVFILFPDPWPKRRHHKRRLLNGAFLRLLATRLAPQGRIHVATDWADYARFTLESLREVPELANLAGTGRYAPRPRWRPQTKYERAALAAGREVHELALAPAPGRC